MTKKRTSNKDLGKRIKDLEDELKREKAISGLFSQVLDTVHVSVWYWDLKTDEITTDPRFYDILGFGPQKELRIIKPCKIDTGIGGRLFMIYLVLLQFQHGITAKQQKRILWLFMRPGQETGARRLSENALFPKLFVMPEKIILNISTICLR